MRKLSIVDKPPIEELQAKPQEVKDAQEVITRTSEIKEDKT